MGLFGGASSASSSQTLTNTLSVNPVFNVGDSNSADTGFSASTRAASDASATTKDEFGMAASAGLAFGANSQAQGGTASLARGGDVQPTDSSAISPSSSVFGGNNAGSSNGNLLLYGLIAAAGIFIISKIKKKDS